MEDDTLVRIFNAHLYLMNITGKLFSVFININKDCLIPALKKSKIRLGGMT